MDNGEFFVLLVSMFIAGWGWYEWYAALSQIDSVRRKNPGFSLLNFGPLVSLGGIFIVLKTLASFDVRNSGYLFFYLIFGAAWIVIGRELLFYLYDISWRDDAIERKNLAAVYTVSGGILGISGFYAGANIGDGPGWWCVVFAGGLAAITWFGLIWVIEKTCRISEKITIERDIPTGIRTAYYLIASGIICGRGAAGDWTSAGKTITEFLDAWPVLLLTLIAIVVQRSSYKDNSLGTVKSLSLKAHLWGVFYLIFAIIVVLLSPPLPQNSIYGGFINLFTGVPL